MTSTSDTFKKWGSWFCKLVHFRYITQRRLRLRSRGRRGKEFEADDLRVGATRADGSEILRHFLELRQQGQIHPGAEGFSRAGKGQGVNERMRIIGTPGRSGWSRQFGGRIPARRLFIAQKVVPPSSRRLTSLKRILSRSPL